MIAPVPNWVILAGYVSGGVARGVCVGLVVAGVSLIFSRFSIERADIVVAVFFTTSLLFSLGHRRKSSIYQFAQTYNPAMPEPNPWVF